ncbi:Regulator of protease activity HflC, stomatin/prohibitin superfamily [Halopseudomonas litoralis]|uniref:Regulator of protease activity HflC, stomatin/prohibitin superfamily n=1 Tax=Halopseudomonas litoralis TaxID=797277 RepID=A0A1H1VTV3_9GAMM|nr:stomatin-like protein [Halopseudomonas litoralis]SDS88193.1 Regulator of protease activity HflC, stomatin/prohibitin superfamily [Halopseudomonas litoralis]
MEIATMLSLALLVFIVIAIAKTAQIVPQRSAFVVERLGKYAKTLEAGFHLLIPFVDRIAYRHTMKEEAIDVDRQACVTKDNIQVVVNGVIYLQVVDPKAASYGITNYRFAATQLAQTTLRSVIGKIDLDKTFEEREAINIQVVQALDEAARPWGVKVMRYEIADIELPATILDALEKQMRAERERRAVVAQSEGEREAKINVSEGIKQETINLSIADKERQINEAEGKARQIELVAQATADGLRLVADAITMPGGKDAVALRVAEQYVTEFGKLAKTNNTMILPAELSNIGAAVAAITKTLDTVKQ